MSPTLADVLLLRFGAFELDPHKGELRKAGMLVKLSPQPFQVLQLLAANSGELQSREQIQREVWGNDTFVDFDRNLNVCMAQIRAALNDDADSPRFVQTVPRRGYRFLAPVERVSAAEAVEPVAIAAPRRTNRWLITGLVLVLAAAAFLGWRVRPTPVGRPLLAILPMENLSADANDDRFIDGLTEELISQLGGLHPGRLGVIARSSVMRYKSARKSIDQVGSELGVNYVVEGTVQRSGDRVRVTAEGQFRTCLFALDETDLRVVLRAGRGLDEPDLDDRLATAIEGAVATKWAGHRIGQVDFIRPDRSMSQIGG